MNTPNGTDLQIISNPPYCVQGRNIQPIDVIERWALCHHLGCAVKYLEQAGRKTPLPRQVRLEQTRLEQARLRDLRKAEWYLTRELEGSRQCPFIPMGAQPFTTDAVLDDWGLSFHSSEALFHIKASKSPSMKKESLTQALKHLKAEIASLEQHIIDTEIETAPL
jgi:hypothetical protein